MNNTEGLDKEQTIEGVKQEFKSMKEQGVYTEVHSSQLSPEQRKKIIKSRWVLRQKGSTVRARIVAKGYTEEINDNDDMKLTGFQSPNGSNPDFSRSCFLGHSQSL